MEKENALKILRELHDKALFSERTALETFIPELKESEDEMIRKALIEHFRWNTKQILNEFSNKEALAWLENIPYTIDHEKREGFHLGYKAALEKQGKQKSIWHNEDEEPQKDSLILLIMQSGTPIVAKIIEPNHTFNHGERWAYIDDLLEKQGNQKPAEWNEDSNSIISDLLDYFDEDKCLKHEVNDIVKWLKTIKPQQKGWGDNEIKMFDNLITYLDGRKDLLEEIKRTYIDWLKSIKSRVKPKQEWSEEDQNALEDVRESVVHYWGGDTQDILLYWLKSLKQRIKGE